MFLFKFLFILLTTNSYFVYSKLVDEEKLIKEELVTFFKDVDSDEDHQLNVNELANWVKKIHFLVIEDNVSNQWKTYDREITEEHTWQDYETSKKETLTWEKYYEKNLNDYIHDSIEYNDSEVAKDTKELEEEFEKIMASFKKRWLLADEDGSNYLTKTEFKYFLHPEESKNETLLEVISEDLKKELDTDGDKIVSLNEYLNHIKLISNPEDVQDKDFEKVNKENFYNLLDQNKDGALDLSELKNWLIPNVDRHKLKASELIETYDSDSNNELDLEEIINNYENFYNLLPPEFYKKTKKLLHEQQILHDEF